MFSAQKGLTMTRNSWYTSRETLQMIQAPLLESSPLTCAFQISSSSSATADLQSFNEVWQLAWWQCNRLVTWRPSCDTRYVLRLKAFLRFRKGLRLSDNAALVEVQHGAASPFVRSTSAVPGFQSWCKTCLQRPKLA